MQTRNCSTCGFTEYLPAPATGHTEVQDDAIPATCTENGKTAGKHCSVCNTILVAQSVVPSLGHTEIEDAAIPATCTESGKTAGKHCSVCNTILVAQSVIPSLGHTEIEDAAIPATCTESGKTAGKHCNTCGTVLTEQTLIPSLGHTYNEGEIITTASCTSDGTKKYTCTIPGCGYSYTEAYSMPTFTATEIYDQSIKYVGEICTYDKHGEALALGTGFLITSDGQIVTNYHVIENAYSAKITIDGKTYNIESVLAYDADIDLAILKINAINLSFAPVCKTCPKVGETIYAIGSSRGMTNTYSQGIVTYADRVVDGVSYVQHDASITNGNSGGPLINEYGEVIGINTWGFDDSQNLNFAIFADELDNLTYEKQLTMTELYEKEFDAFMRMKNYIIENGVYVDADVNDDNYYENGVYVDTENNYYQLQLYVSSNAEITIVRYAHYYEENDTIALYIVAVGWGMFAGLDYTVVVYFEFDKSLSGEYFWNYSDVVGGEMQGTIYASTYTSSSLLEYNYYNYYLSPSLSETRRVSSGYIHLIVSQISQDFSDIGVSAKDLGFIHY